MPIKRISLGPVNCYLITTAAGLFLIDSGTTGSGEQLIRGIAEAGEDIGAVKLIILTHGHSDHAGGAAYLKQKYGMPVAIHQNDAAYVQNASNAIPPGTSALANIIGGLMAFASRKSTWEGFNPDHILNGTTNMNDFGLDAKLLEFPGHTPGSIGLLLPNGDLIAGDLVTNFRKPGLGMFATDIDRMKQDIGGLQALGVKRIFPGHGRPFEAELIKGIR